MPDRQRDAGLQADLVADGVDHPVDPGHAVLGPPLPRHRVGAGQPGQPQHGPLDGHGGVPVREVDDRLRGAGGQLPRPAPPRVGSRVERCSCEASPIGCRRRRASSAAGGAAAARSRTADRVSVGRPQGEVRPGRRRPAGRPGARRGRRTSRRGWRRRRRRRGAGPEPGVRWSTAACTPPHGSSGVTGASLPRARATPASARSANGLVAERPLGAQPLGVHAGVPAPGRVEGRLHAGDHPPGRASARCRGRVDHLHVLQPVPAGPDGGRARARRPRRSTASSTWATAASPMHVEAGLDAGQRAARARGRPAAPVVEAQRARRSPAGRCRASLSAAVCEPKAPSQNRSPPAPASPSSRTTSSPPRSASSPQ